LYGLEKKEMIGTAPKREGGVLQEGGGGQKQPCNEQGGEGGKRHDRVAEFGRGTGGQEKREGEDCF